jgi:hypothetical protein
MIIRFYTTALASLGLLLLVSAVMATDLPDFQDAIRQAQVRDGNDRRPDLRQCVRQWAVLGKKRTALYDELDKDIHGSIRARQIVLEIGNSGFPKYEYVHINGSHLSSSLGGSMDLSGYSFGDLLERIYAGQAPTLSGRAHGDTEDDNCYFLTVITNKGQISVAIYGQLMPTFTELLIAYLVDVARRE